MKHLDISIDLKDINISEEEKKVLLKLKDSGVFEITLNNMVVQKYPQGTPGPLSRVLYRILNKLDRLEGTSLELEEAEVDLIQEAFLNPDLKLLPGQLRLVMIYINKIEALKG